MAIGSPLDARALELNVKRQWRVWAGRFASSAYAPGIEIEYNAIRTAAALLDLSPLYSYRVNGPDALHLVDRVITRDATRIAPGQVIYTPWCDEHGKVIDDGTVARLDDGSIRWTAAEPQLRWLRMNARGLDVTVEETSESLAALALQGPLSRAVLEVAAGADLAGLRPFRRQALAIGELAVDVSRTGYTGDLGYELWVDADRALELWDRLSDVGRAYALRAAGIWALDVARIEAGLIMLDVDYTSSTHASIPDQAYSPAELRLGRLVDLDKATPFVGRTALLRERDAGGPARRLVGLELDWEDLERLTARHGLTPTLSPSAWRGQIPVFAAGRQIGRATSGTWSPVRKSLIALASVEAAYEPAGTPIQMEWTVEGVRGRISAAASRRCPSTTHPTGEAEQAVVIAVAPAPAPPDGEQRFPIRLQAPTLLRLFGVRPGERAMVTLTADTLDARFGWAHARVPLTDLTAWDISGPWSPITALGIRRSIRGGDLTFGGSAHGGVQVHFRQRPKIMIFRPPSLFLTVDDLEGLGAALTARGIPGEDLRARA